MSCFFHSEAARELDAAIDYYEDCAPGLGLDFSVEVQAAIKRLLLFPAACPRLVDDVRRCLVNRFPYGILYRQEGEQIHIIAIMHLSRDPQYWRKRVKSREE